MEHHIFLIIILVFILNKFNHKKNLYVYNFVL